MNKPTRSPTPPARKYSTLPTPNRQAIKAKIAENPEINIIFIILFDAFTIILFSSSLGCIFGAWGENSHCFFVSLTYIGSIIYFLCRLILSIWDKPIKDILYDIWMSKYLHYIIFSWSFYYSNISSLIFSIDYTLVFLLELLELVEIDIAPRAGDLGNTLKSISNPIRNCNEIHRLSAFLEILLIPYLLIYAFTFRSQVLLTNIFYFIFFIFPQSQIDRHHHWIWNLLKNKVSAFGYKNKDTIGDLFQVVEAFKKINEVVKIIYPTV